jgi:hypothetical protein
MHAGCRRIVAVSFEHFETNLLGIVFEAKRIL